MSRSLTGLQLFRAIKSLLLPQKTTRLGARLYLVAGTYTSIFHRGKVHFETPPATASPLLSTRFRSNGTFLLRNDDFLRIIYLTRLPIELCNASSFPTPTAILPLTRPKVSRELFSSFPFNWSVDRLYLGKHPRIARLLPANPTHLVCGSWYETSRAFGATKRRVHEHRLLTRFEVHVRGMSSGDRIPLNCV